MTLLPILGRELGVRARSRANYWGRVAVAAVGVLVCVPPLVWSGPFISPGATGRAAFDGLVSAGFLLCCAACLLTADTISSERREGTLGLLLLTRVKPLDVLLGKFASNGLTCLLGLVALLPVLALPLLSGGVSGGEAARKAAALLHTLFLALSVGLWASARGCERFRTARAALLVLAGLVLGPSLVELLLPGTHAGTASPLGTMAQAGDPAYKTAAAQYWLSLGLVQMVGWGFLCSAIAPLRSWAGQAENEAGDGMAQIPPRLAALPPTANAVLASPALSPSITNCRYCGRQNPAPAVFCHECGTELFPKAPPRAKPFNLSSAPTPLHWLLGRQRGLNPALWAAATIGFCHYALFGMLGRSFGFGLGTPLLGISYAFGLVTAAMMGWLVAWAASRFFVEARRTGELELLLTTPLGAEQIVSAQWDLLKRRLRWPVLVMLVPAVLQGLILFSFRFPASDLVQCFQALSVVLSAVNSVLSFGALCWLALCLGLRVVGPGRAILWTVLLAKGFPYLLGLTWALLYRSLVTSLRTPGSSWLSSFWLFGSLVPQLATLLFYLWLIGLARRHLLDPLAGAETSSPGQLLSRARPRLAAAIRRARQWPAV